MSEDRTTLTALLHGESGAGKSWTGASTPTPRLIIDVEGRAKHIPHLGRVVYWDAVSEAPPAAGEWDTCIAPANTFSVLPTVYSWLRSGQHPFRSATVDSLMEAQKRWVDQNIGDNTLKTQDWGAVLRALESFVRNMRDVVNYPEAHLDVVVIICGSVPDERGRQRPLLQGQLKNTLPYYFDVVGWQYIVPNPADPQQMMRVLNVGPTPYAVAKDGTGRLGGPEIDVSNLETTNLTTLYQNYDQQRRAEVSA